jgi:hypothetical protein
LPCFFIHGNPVTGNFKVDVTVPDGCLFQPLSERLSTTICYEMLDRLVNETAALAGLDHPVNGSDGGLREHYVDALAHGGSP